MDFMLEFKQGILTRRGFITTRQEAQVYHHATGGSRGMRDASPVYGV
jgi:hypothetical protein